MAIIRLTKIGNNFRFKFALDIPLIAQNTSLKIRVVLSVTGGKLLVAQLVEALGYKPEGSRVRFPMVSSIIFH